MSSITVGNMRTMGDQPVINMEYEDSYGIAKGYTTSDTLLVGQVVKLNTDGTVSKIAAVTDIPFGVVVSSYGLTSAGKVRVLTPFAIIMSNVLADGTLAPGDLVSCSGDTNGVAKFKKSVSTNYVVGRCLVGGLTGTAVQIGIFYQGGHNPLA